MRKVFNQYKKPFELLHWHDFATFSKKVVRMSLYSTSILLLLLNSISSTQAEKILVLGDSLGAAYKIPWESGWAQLLEADLLPQHQVINASVSGETTGGGLARLPVLLEEHQPNWVMVELGGNDGLRGYPLKTIRQNLTQIAHLIEAQGGSPIFVGMRIPPNYGQRYNEAFSAIFKDISAEFNAPYLDFYIEEVINNPDMMQADKIHPSEAAQVVIFDKVKSFLEPLLLAPSSEETNN